MFIQKFKIIIKIKKVINKIDEIVKKQKKM